jgi:ATP-dependent RNA helicase HelY
LAGLVSTFVYEHRAPDDPPAPWFSSKLARQRWTQIEQLSVELAFLEQQHGLAVHRPPEPTFFAVAYAWVAGEGFAEVVGEEELTGGDFVRTVKQLIDLLGQVATVATDPETQATARRAADACFRGVVADASLVAEVADVSESETAVAEAS